MTVYEIDKGEDDVVRIGVDDEGFCLICVPDCFALEEVSLKCIENICDRRGWTIRKVYG